MEVFIVAGVVAVILFALRTRRHDARDDTFEARVAAEVEARLRLAPVAGDRSTPKAAAKPFTTPKTTPATSKTFHAFEARPSLFVNTPEYALFCALHATCPSHLRLMAKVRLEDIVRVKPHIRNEIGWMLRNRIKSRHVDFALCDHDGVVRCVIELDGKSHDASTRDADDFKDGLFQTVGIPLHRIKVGQKFAPRVASILADLKPR